MINGLDCRGKSQKNMAGAPLGTPDPCMKGSEMPKMKTKSSVKKRFKVTATGKIKVAGAGKQHGMIKRSNKFLRNARGTMVLSDPDTRIVKKFMPYANK
jgi:large subunit ribosomal protein L35